MAQLSTAQSCISAVLVSTSSDSSAASTVDGFPVIVLALKDGLGRRRGVVASLHAVTCSCCMPLPHKNEPIGRKALPAVSRENKTCGSFDCPVVDMFDMSAQFC